MHSKDEEYQLTPSMAALVHRILAVALDTSAQMVEERLLVHVVWHTFMHASVVGRLQEVHCHVLVVGAGRRTPHHGLSLS